SGGGEYSYDTPAATAAASPAPTAAAPPAAGAGTVTISDFAFRPDPVVVAAGGTLTLRNGGRASHTFTILALKIDLTVASGQSATVQIQGAPGTYDLVCRFHEAGGMYAKLEIK
ncbi:MAG: cupredoxin domain-containing protein, partial [Actinobacteria bacterium]|nr:cupredoxin domain-containing protein [Actinomycetota bacterium]